MNEHKKLAILALQSIRGDDFERAKRQFHFCTAKEMLEEYGFTGETRAKVFAEYEAHAGNCDAAIAWIKAQPD